MSLTFVAATDDALALNAIDELSRLPGVAAYPLAPGCTPPKDAIAVFAAAGARFPSRNVRIVNRERDPAERGVKVPEWAASCMRLVALQNERGTTHSFTCAVREIPKHLLQTSQAREKMAANNA